MSDTSSGWTRREWLQLTAAGALQAAAIGGRAEAAAAKRFGVQLYTVREQLKSQAQATLKAIADIGYKEVELSRADLATIGPMAKSVGLAPTSLHIEAPLVTGNWEPWVELARGVPASERPTLQKALDAARAQGITYAVVSYLVPGERGTNAAAYETFADQLNHAGEVARAAGVTLGYHNHGFEFAPLPDGRRPLDVLAAKLDPARVKLELDVFWVSITGADPVALLAKLKGLVALVHLKDKAKGAPVETDERKVAKATFTEVGSGALDFPAILKAADAAGVEHYFVEQDQTPGDPVASLRKSYEYLAKLA